MPFKTNVLIRINHWKAVQLIKEQSSVHGTNSRFHAKQGADMASIWRNTHSNLKKMACTLGKKGGVCLGDDHGG